MLDLLLFGQKTAPDFFWDARGGVLPPGASFTRGSAGWSFNRSGVLTQAANNVARFDYDPVTLAPLGYLAEPQSTNGLLQSGDQSNASWTASGVTVTGNSSAAPDGTTTMAKLLESAANVAHKVSQVVTLATATTAGFSWFVKASSRSKFYISVQASSANYATAIFDTAGAGTTASQTSVGGTSGTIVETGIRSVGGGIYRIWMAAKVTGANPTVVLGLASLATGNTVSATGDVTYTGDGASFGFGWGAQFDTATFGVTSYVPTTTTTVTRAADLLSLPLASLPGWSVGQGGVVQATYRLHTNDGGGNTQDVFMITDGGTNYIEGSAQSGTQAGPSYSGLLMRATSFQINQVAFVNGTAWMRRKHAWGWGTTRGQIAVDGALGATASGSYLLPVAPTMMWIGGTSPSSLTGTIEGIAYYVGARSDGFVQAVTR